MSSNIFVSDDIRVCSSWFENATFIIEAEYESDELKDLFFNAEEGEVKKETRAINAYCNALEISGDFKGIITANNCYSVKVVSFHFSKNSIDAVQEHISFLTDSEFYEDFHLVEGKMIAVDHADENIEFEIDVEEEEIIVPYSCKHNHCVELEVKRIFMVNPFQIRVGGTHVRYEIQEPLICRKCGQQLKTDMYLPDMVGE